MSGHSIAPSPSASSSDSPGSRAAYREAQREALGRATARLQQAAAEAVETLRSVMSDGTQQGAARVGAAKAVLDYALKTSEREEIVERLEDLERSVDRERPRQD